MGDILYKELAKKYINIVDVNIIKNFAIKNKILISDNEATIILDFIKSNYLELLDGDISLFNKLKGKVRNELYYYIIDLYNKNKDKFLT